MKATKTKQNITLTLELASNEVKALLDFVGCLSPETVKDILREHGDIRNAVAAYAVTSAIYDCLSE